MEARKAHTPTIGGMELKPDFTFTISDEELKNYYLKEAALLLPDILSPRNTEEQCLTALHAEQKEIVNVLDKLLDASFRLDINCLYEVTFSYLMRDDIEKKERERVSNDMVKLFAIFTLLQQKLDVIAELYNHFNSDYANVKRLVEQYAEK